MSYDGSVFDHANYWLYESVGSGVTIAQYTNTLGYTKDVKLMDIPVSDLQFLGSVDVRTDAQYKLVSKSEVPTRPVEGETLVFNGIRYWIKSAEADETHLNWRVDLDRGGS